ncbi:MAG: hypothetical protein EBU90_16680 [Proteobacteria bacterium]|nr:hypothetical protein [Pseudomonadota bacterium]
MKIKILNCPDKAFKPFVFEAAQFFAKELIPDSNVLKYCKTTIVFTDKITEYGYASIKKHNRKKQAREFKIEIHPGIGARLILETLAHEMVHVKQYIMNETDDGLTRWKNKKIDSNKVDYWNHPWEIDAYGREPGLIYKFATLHCLWNVFEEFKNPDDPIVSRSITWKVA